MNVQVKLFAVARQLAGRAEVDVQLEPNATILRLRTALAEQVPELSTLVGDVLFAIENEYTDDATILTDDAIVACIPPVSGG